MKTIFANLREFKYEDTVLKEIYGHVDSTYQFTFLIDSILVLNNLIVTTYGFAQQKLTEYLIIVAQHLEMGNFEKLQYAIEALFLDIENRKIPHLLLKQHHAEVYNFRGIC